MIKNFETFDVALTVLSPIHIGCGEEYEPTNFVADPNTNVIYTFDPAQVPLTSDQRGRLLRAVNEAANAGSVSPIYHFYEKEIDRFKVFSQNVIPFDPVIRKRIENLSVKGGTANDNRVQRIVYHINDDISVPYIPGSSLKGAIHTAFLDRLANGMNLFIQKDRKRPTDFLDREIFKGTMGKSPMKLISVSDFHARDPLAVKQYLLSANRLYKKEENSKGAPGAFEVLAKAQYRAFSGTISLRNPHSSEEIAKRGRFYKTIQTLFQDLNRYSLAEFKTEIDFWEKVNKSNTAFFKSLRQLIANLDPAFKQGKIALVRIGKNTGAQNMTLRKPGIPQIKVHPKKQIFAENPTTVFAANDNKMYLPFGWALLECNPQGSNESLRQWCESNQSKSDYKKLREDFRQERKAIQDKILKLEKEHQEQKALAEQKEKERHEFLSSLSEERKQLLILKEKIQKEGEVNPGTETAKMLTNIMAEAKSWSLDNKKAFVDELAPLVKKYISKGKINKEIKKVLAEFREAK